jgi:serine/threonine protein phosphatase 1
MSAVVERRRFALPRGLSPDAEIFAVGDIHGRADLLDALIGEARREPRLREKRAIVFLGDLVDRGPDSLGAIDLAIGAAARIGADDGIALMGNHEAMMRLALDPETPWDVAVDALETWIANGGDRTLAEFVEFDEPPGDVDELLAAARASLPPRVRAWLASLRASWRSGDILFVHAGVNPRVDIDAFLAVPWNTPLFRLNEDRHWAWVRRPFLEHRPGPKGFSGLFVVHGHTPNDARRDASHDDQIARFRLNLDAGSVLTGVAKMAIIRGAEAEVVVASGPTGRELRLSED